MFLQCRQLIMHVPKSSETCLVFPFNVMKCRFTLEKKNQHASDSRVPFSKIQQSLKEINAACKDFGKLKLLRNFFWLLVLLAIAGVLTGGALINSGLRKSSSSSTDLPVLTDSKSIVVFSNVRITVGAVIVGFSLLVFLVATILMIRMARRLRITYEKVIFETITELNKELKEFEMRWKIGLYLRWIEISFDYKKRSNVEQKNEDQSKGPTNIDFDPTNVQISVLPN